MSSTGSINDGKIWARDDLEGLPPTVNIYPWEGPDHFQNIVDSELQGFKDPQRSSPCDWIVFSNVSETIFEHDFQEETDLTKQWKSYNRSRQLLFVEIARGTTEHTEATQTFNDILKEAVDRMGLSTALKCFSGTTIQGDDWAKVPDNGWGPRHPPAGRSRKWPTVALEVGVSQRPPKLEEDACFWLEESEGDVKISLVISVDPRTPEIVLEKWNISNGKPAMTRKVTVWRRNEDILFENEPLVIEFEDLFLREADNPCEVNIEFDQGSLRRLAENIWLEQGFME
ncbi:hypothetical protein CNMCM6936_005965 [Aspergillus lentulus]|uniref:Uncharacterized protein n=1 Tax=Aspergillus lentulus TaxID=293939 RepID=A0AAN5YPJ8_ASPLE|nr:hypothetical protein CNMCM6069_006703 [Aspergillus lentulus]KAF4166803.1 hypothetical protein CNMCM6936_005965 [Aspergillus lentulus]KAF4176091.1 hypothetical protein CNMCM8060_006641 [Aspergillus lentulus]KAF4194857.1 hypothetical protein CNMCM8694_007101 [Aspergillus lentulus]KAF4204919.1 hypothetical protein CNMCM8927_006952 [Aspergillus lentulus]